MLDAQQDAPVYICGRYRIDPLRRRIYIDGVRVAVTAKAFDVLVELVKRAGSVVTKDELLTSIWTDSVVEENNLTQQISTLRKLFNDRADAPEFIATIPGRGYCFSAPVAVEQTEFEHTAIILTDPPSLDPSINNSDSIVPVAGGPFVIDPATLRGTAIAIAYILIIFSAMAVFAGRDFAPLHNARSVGILTFRSVGNDGDRYGVGIRDTLRAKLGSLDEITLRPGQIDTPNIDTLTAGRRMNADLVLSGSVQQQDGHIRVTVEMIDVHSERVVWGNTFDDDTANVFKLQDSIADEVIRTLQSTNERRVSEMREPAAPTAVISSSISGWVNA